MRDENGCLGILEMLCEDGGSVFMDSDFGLTVFWRKHLIMLEVTQDHPDTDMEFAHRIQKSFVIEARYILRTMLDHQVKRLLLK